MTPSSDDAETHSNAADALLRLGRLDEAVAGYRRALELKPQYVAAHINLGNAWLGLGRLDEAAASYRRALTIQPDFAEVHSNLGNALLALGLFEDAAASCRRAIKLKPQYAEAHNNLGNALLELGRLDDAVASYRRALELKPQYAEAHNNLGNALLNLGQFDAALALFQRALSIRSDFVEAHTNLGNALLKLGRLDDALASYRRALELKPQYAEAHNNLGNALLNLGQLDAALTRFHRALALKPQYAEAHNNVGTTLLEFGRLDDAVASYQRALALKPRYAEAHGNLGAVLRLLGRADEAEASCRRALELDPNAAATVVTLAGLRADQGQFAQAQALFERAIAIEPQSPEGWAGLAHLRRMTDSDSAWLAAAQRIVEQRLPPQRESVLHNAIGKYFDDVRDFEQAFIHYRRANDVVRGYRGPHDRQQVTQAVDRIIHTYDQEWLSHHGRIHANASARPVFIVGMPRSGTSLAEQILASHPSVFGAGELAYWSTASATYPAVTLGQLANDYLGLLEQQSIDALRVVDKMPGNFMHLGLIHAALPNARILHMQRNPIDTCLSIYFQHFGAVHTYAHDLEDLAHYFTEYTRLMQHWRSTLPAEVMLEVPYEGLVQEQEAWSRNMLQFIGLPWDPICLEFHQTDRTVLTASRWQVRQKVSIASVARWRHYEKYVGPLLHLAHATAPSAADQAQEARAQ